MQYDFPELNGCFQQMLACTWKAYLQVWAANSFNLVRLKRRSCANFKYYEFKRTLKCSVWCTQKHVVQDIIRLLNLWIIVHPHCGYQFAPNLSFLPLCICISLRSVVLKFIRLVLSPLDCETTLCIICAVRTATMEESHTHRKHRNIKCATDKIHLRMYVVCVAFCRDNTRETGASLRDDCLAKFWKIAFWQSAFSVRAADKGNSLPIHIRQCTSFSFLKQHFKHNKLILWS